MDLPLVLCRSKSGGAHLYMHFKQPVPAKQARDALVGCMQALGFDGCEIFPKQTQRTSDKNIGNWINLPYYSAVGTDRYCLKDGKPLGFDEYLEWVEENKVSIEDLERLPQLKGNKSKPPPRRKQNNEKEEGRGDKDDNANPAEGRNDYLFREGCRLRAFHHPEAAIRAALHAMNNACTPDHHPKFIDGPLPADEVERIVQSVMSYDSGPPPQETLSPEKGLEYMNGKYAVVMEEGKAIIISTVYDPALERNKVRRSQYADIKKHYKKRVLLGFSKKGAVTRPLGEWWLNHPEAARYDEVAFMPRKNIEGIYNLWRGFGVIPNKNGTCDLFYDHIFSNICSGNKAYNEYVLDWLADSVQKPDRPGGTAVAARGGRGTGKSIVGRTMGKVHGQHYLQISNARHMTGHFNAHLQDVTFLFSDEAFWAGDKAGESTLKTLLTEPSIFLERKGVNGHAVPNCLHIYMASNQDWVVPAGIDERRFFVLEVSEKRKQDHQYFGELVKELESGGYEKLLHDLQQRDLSNYRPEKMPKTGELTKQKIRTLSAEHRWLYRKLEAGKILNTHEGWVCEVEKKDVQDDYINEARNLSVPHRSDQTVLGIMLKEFFPTLQTKKRYGRLLYVFPPLEECRAHFEKKINDKIDWPEDDGSTEDDEPM